MDNQKGLYGKYQIIKTDGSPTDPEAVYFTLRLDTDPHARNAVRAYIASVKKGNPELAADLYALILEIERTNININTPMDPDPIILILEYLFGL